MKRTPLTPEQYSELVRALEIIHHIAVGVEYPLRRMWMCGEISPFAFVYITQWFYVISRKLNVQHLQLYWLQHMISELCKERC